MPSSPPPEPAEWSDRLRRARASRRLRLPAPPRPAAPACLVCGWLLDGPCGPAVVVHVEAPGNNYDLCGRCAGS